MSLPAGCHDKTSIHCLDSTYDTFTGRKHLYGVLFRQILATQWCVTVRTDYSIKTDFFDALGSFWPSTREGKKQWLKPIFDLKLEAFIQLYNVPCYVETIARKYKKYFFILLFCWYILNFSYKNKLVVRNHTILPTHVKVCLGMFVPAQLRKFVVD